MISTHKTVLASVVALGLTPIANATLGTLEFEDLTTNTDYNNGTTFATDGVTVNVVDFYFSNGDPYSGGSAFVADPAIDSGKGLCMGNVNLEFEFDPATTIAFEYAEFGGNVNLTVNGILLNEDDFLDMHGSNAVPGVTIDVNDSMNEGIVTLTGNITEFCVGGQELCIDNVRCVPTPGIAGLMSVAGLATLRRRRR